ncbi:MAG: hypothetical protein KDJ20_09000 [Hyphomicrobiales bacterium]|nr:hypothetical protein [Rhodoblastus sp.]MCB9999567.1 hypothetical protein [Methylobacteriaceae bacterium]MCC2099956.1 hypothetical protein [Hyphomicrobiales bacterium]HRY03464.1 hypothetical protein [Beijerinckiaceae bacterium]MCB1523879.1 hypothetical protein [Rhodoblastus sp.]
MSKFKLVLAFCGALIAGGAAMSVSSASAAPMVDPFVAGSTQTTAPNVEKARIVCNAWGRCWRTGPRYYRPRYYRPRYYRPRFYGRPGYRRHYRRW